MSTIARVGKIKEKDQSIYQRIAKGVNSPQAGELKDLLSAAGYKGLGTGNKFGAKAVKALKQFQENQGMAATGVADDDTWTALLAQFDGVSPQGNPYNTFQGGSADLADLTATEVNRPGGYVSPYQDQIDALLAQVSARPEYAQETQFQAQYQNLLDGLLQRQPFSYDLNADPLYQQYKDQYMAGGQAAMADVMGQAAALTGGYGNSYAATAGSQAYQTYLQGLNDRALDLYDRAYARYQDEGQSMLAGLSALQAQQQSLLSRYQADSGALGDSLSALQALDQAAYDRYRDSVADWQEDRDYYYQKTQDEQDQENWQMEYDYDTRKWKKRR